MELADLKKLIPYYIAGTLAEKEKLLVEDGLIRFPELKAEIQFWRRARRATIENSAFEALGHPSAEALVDYAEGLFVSEPGTAASIREHLRECRECSTEYDMIAGTLAQPKQYPEPRDWAGELMERLKAWFRIPYAIARPVPALAAALVVVFAAVFFWQTPSDHVSMTLQYEVHTRADPGGDIPVLQMEDGTQTVEFDVEIPRTTVIGTRYLVHVTDSKTDTREFPGLYETTSLNDQLDVIRFTLERVEFFPVKGMYTLTIDEDLPPGSNLTPERYTYRLEVRTRTD